LQDQLRKVLRDVSRAPRQDGLLKWTFAAELETATVDVRLELDSGSHRQKFFLAGYQALDRRLYVAASLPGFCFEVLPGQALEERARHALRARFRELERSEGTLDWSQYALTGKARLAYLEIEFQPALEIRPPARPSWAALFGDNQEKSGAEELESTARPLHSLYPDELDRVVGRETEVATLVSLLTAAERRPLLLVGPRQVGKTALLHEAVWQIRSRQKDFPQAPRQFWWVSPMRLISGMSTLGEWENRVLAILGHAHQQGHALCFDDLPGLFSAGMHSGSDLNVAQVLKPFLEKHQVRVVAEISPEGWRVLRERDRTFADLFHLLPVVEPTETETLNILVRATRQLELAHSCELALEVIPTVHDLCRRFARDAAFPGKALTFLRRLAVKHAGAEAGRAEVLSEFHERSGLQLALLDGRAGLDRATLTRELGSRVIGQETAVTALVEVLIRMKARLNDPRRPLGTLLFLGPTGVGKTEAARALATYLFDDPDRLVRFDANELIDPGSARRLMGTPRDPEGLLTGALRRQPFSVVLIDEIEKAAPEVFDVLLAVLDEGRLTDALGRTADFTNAIVILTSNLGVREAASQMGFQADTQPAMDLDTVFVTAAEKFFRPEFFNRLDRVVPFRVLGRESLETIARQRVAEVLGREGLRRRECCLRVAPAALARLVELGHHPQLGARALKRTLEREMAQPLAEHLAARIPGMPSVADLVMDQGRLQLHLQSLAFAERAVPWPERYAALLLTPPWTPSARPILADLVTRARQAASRLRDEILLHAPQGGVLPETLAAGEVHYFHCREQLAVVDGRLRQIEAALLTPARRTTVSRTTRPDPSKTLPRQRFGSLAVYARQRDAEALRIDLQEWEQSETDLTRGASVGDLLRDLALLQAMIATPPDDPPVVLMGHGLDGGKSADVQGLMDQYEPFFSSLWGVTCQRVSTSPLLPDPLPQCTAAVQTLFLRGPAIRQLVQREAGTHLMRHPRQGLNMIRIAWRQAGSKEAPQDGKMLQQDPGMEVVPTDVTEPPFPPVVRVFEAMKAVTDVRSGVTLADPLTTDAFRTLVLSGLPLPPELT
jgi:ATP-dependent Clp protease ATP-binding subunit ClpA